MDKIYSVSEFNNEIKRYLDINSKFKEVFIEGEISGITYYKSGHLYFTLKEKDAQVKCVAFKYKFKKIPEDLKEGEVVKIFGDLGFYENRGEIQILVRYIEKQNNLGELFAKLEKLKVKLKEEGYFDDSRKRALAKYPKAIGVVTAITGAAIHDIVKTVRKRDSSIDIYLYPAKVQGIGSENEIIKGIESLNKIPEIDFIIAGRGGGSIEDLWSFNDEKVAMAFFNSKKPIISAVGHESDFLLTDLVADVRAATPTQAIELSIPEKETSKKDLLGRKNYMDRLVLNKISSSKLELKRRTENYSVRKFPSKINELRQSLILKEDELKKYITKTIEKKNLDIDFKLKSIINLNPLKILDRGYSIVSVDGKIIRKSSEVNIGDEISINLSEGKIKSIVKEIK